ncbi:MAG: putative transposase [Planctomycetota bacterium]|jgi:putative transposase
MLDSQIRAVLGYKKHRCVKGRPTIFFDNKLDREFTVEQPNEAWVTDITHIRTWQGQIYLVVVIDLYSRKVVGWSHETITGTIDRYRCHYHGRAEAQA